MAVTLRDYFLLFIIYSFIGWVIEVIYILITKKSLTNRGFLVGPYCPIYGVGALFIVIFLSKYSNYPIGLFVLAIVACSILEYATSYIMEKAFKARWWDYTNNKFNINGRICLETMIPFGIIACLVVYIINPFILKVFSDLPSVLLSVLAIVFAFIFISDLITSFNIINNFKKTVKVVSMEDRTGDINKYIKRTLLKKSFFYRRLINAFPKSKANIINIKNKIKNKRQTKKSKDNKNKIKKD